ncbi:MAG TPA: sulfatase-like hydrolase/transferase [Cytophagaceae bacterium]|jgi:arylsulfatase A-like enzyme
MRNKYTFLSITSIFLFLIILLVGISGFKNEPIKKNEASKPNIVFIFADDFGNNVPSINGNKYIKTPNIDAIANGGVRFKQNYVTAPICCASRAALLTGRYQQRFGSENHLHYPSYSAYTADSAAYVAALQKQNIQPDERTQGIPSSEINYAELLKKNGYTTGIIGKWHSGFFDGYRPHQRGFDYSWGWYGGSSLYYTDENDEALVTYKDEKGHYHHYESKTGKYQWKRDPIATGIFKNGALVDEKDYQTFAIAREAVNFIETNKAKPFFLYIPFGAVHTPLQAVKKEYDKLGHIKDPQQRIVLAMTVSLDEAVGRIVKKLKDEGLDKNTLIVFSGDNGSTYHRADYPGEGGVSLYDGSYENLNYPLKGGKTTHYEGGIRTPLFIQWAGKIKPGTVYDSPVSSLDLFPTFASASGTTLPTDRKYDGVDLLPYLSGLNKSNPHDILYWRNGFVKSIRKKDFKLMINENDKTVILYDLKNDPYEKNDLASSQPAKVEELKKDFGNWEKGLASPRWKSPKVSTNIVEGQKVTFQP